MKAARVIDPAQQEDRSRIYFGATVLIVPTDDESEHASKRITIVGDDEAGACATHVGWNAPLARALRGAAVGDVRRVELPSGEREYEVVELTYPPN